jgi:glycolate oxidase FAD binding subunit
MNDSFELIPVERVQTVADLGDLVRRTVASGQSVYPVGGRTMLEFGYPPSKPGIVAELGRLDQVIDYPARDMTITVQAGITLERLEKVLGGEKQRLPIDVPHPERASLGGAVACNVSGPRRYGHGTLRDYVIGLSAVNDRGEEIKTGGRVVKNVAGYDLCKLFTGSLGTLGIITQLTLKVRPAPERSVILGITISTDQLASWLDRLHATRTQPACIEVLSPRPGQALLNHASNSMRLNAAPPADSWLVLVGFENDAEVVDWQVRQLGQELNSQILGIWSDAEAEPIWRWLADWQLAGDGVASFKVNIPASAVAQFLQYAEASLRGLQAHAGNGIVWGRLHEGATSDEFTECLGRLRERAAASGGNVVVVSCPNAWKRAVRIWGEPRGDWELMRTIKQCLDPKNVFNPGRWLFA